MTDQYRVIARCVLDKDVADLDGKVTNSHGEEHVYDTCDRDTAMRLVTQLNGMYAGVYEFRMEVAG